MSTENTMQGGAVECGGCSGTGKCNLCKGSGLVVRSGSERDCNKCNGTGICPGCNGSGKVVVPITIVNR